MSDLTPETVEAALSIRGPGGISQSRTLTGSDHVIREAAQKWANPDIEAGAKAAYEHVHGGERWEDAEPLDRERFIGEATVTVDAALGVTEKNELRAPGPIRELSEILDDITEDE